MRALQNALRADVDPAAGGYSAIDLAMNTYTNPKLLDVHAVLDQLPALRLTDLHPSSSVRQAPTARRERLQ